jgi:hypothetical protein
MKLRISYLLLPAALILSSASPAFAADTAPPQLVDWSNGGSADIANSDGQVKATFILSDDSEIDLPKLLLRSLTTSQMTPFATVKVVQKNGKLTSYEATAVVQKGQAPKLWEWVLYPLSDSLGNRDNKFGPGANWVPKVNVFNTEFTAAVVRCENKVSAFNDLVIILDSAEKKYPNFNDFAIFRLKQPVSYTKQDFSICSGKTIDFEPFGTTVGAFRDAVSALIETVQAKVAEATDKAAADKAAADKAAAKPIVKEKTIVCLKGKGSLKVIGKNPKCPAGYKVKK